MPDFSFFQTAKTQSKIILCHPEGIYAIVGAAVVSKGKDPYPDKVGIRRADRMTLN
jgi:hypothetical protein